jgi:branched-chain amino acid transport system permease protein
MGGTAQSTGDYEIERSTRASRMGRWGAAAALLALATLPWWGKSEWMGLAIEFICFLVLAQMWNLLAGYAGLMSIGQQAFLGLGGYGLLVLANHAGVNPFLSVLLGGVIAGALAWPTSWLVFRLHGGYFAIGTWAVAEIYRLVISNIAMLGGGSGQSLTVMGQYARETRELAAYFLALAIASASFAGVYLLLRSKLGLALTAIRDSEVASESQGINVRQAKLWVYIVSAFGCGLVGGLYYLNQLNIGPYSAFSVNWTAFIIFIVVIGGIGTIEGPIFGTILFFILRELLADYGAYYLILRGVVAVAVMLKAPTGIWGALGARYDWHFFPVQRRIRWTEKTE